MRAVAVGILLLVSQAAWAASPLDDTKAFWSMGRPTPDATLRVVGQVTLGQSLSGGDAAASRASGGDGRVAELAGGYLVASGDVRVEGRAMTLLIRARDPSGRWAGTLLARPVAGDPYANLLRGATLDLQRLGARECKRMQDGRSVEFLWRTDPLLERAVPGSLDKDSPYDQARPRLQNPDCRDGVLRVAAPVELIGPSGWHDLLVRFQGPKLQLFVDGVLVDEEFPHGALRHFQTPFLIGAAMGDAGPKADFQGQIDHVALWDRAIGDEEIVALSGGVKRVAQRRMEIEGPESTVPQYWRPSAYNANVGDCMTFFHDGTFHFCYLFDRKHHGQRWGMGAHPWGHASSRDLVHWTHHARALDLTEQTENAMGTGQLIFHAGKYYLYWINHGRRMPWRDAPEHRLADNIYLATSTDGVHFQKQPAPWARIDYGAGGDCNPIVWKAAAGDRFYFYCPNNYKKDGKIVGRPYWFYESADLRSWQETPVRPGFAEQATGEWNSCATYHEWNGWYYFHTANTYRMSRQPLERADARWTKCNGLGDCIAVPQVAPFTGNRRLLVGFGGRFERYATEAVFRELVQHSDGTLGMKWPAEMIPPAGGPLPLKIERLAGDVSPSNAGVRLSATAGTATAFMDRVPANVRITLRVVPTGTPRAFGLCVRGRGDYAAGRELRFEPARQRFRYAMPGGKNPLPAGSRNCPVLEAVAGLDRPFDLDVIVKDDIIDACIDQRRTLFHRNRDATGERLFFFTEGGEVTFENLCVRPLVEAAAQN
jgi:hypothetical protein